MSDNIDLEGLKRILWEQQEKIDKLEKRIELAENYSRQDCLVLRGELDIYPNYDFRQEVMRIIGVHTGVKFPPWCINTCHWLKYGVSIVVRFNNKAVKEEIYKNRISKDNHYSGLLIHELLSPSKSALVATCAKLKRTKKLASYWTQGGNVYVKGSRETPPLLVEPHMTQEDILEILAHQPASYRDAAYAGATRGQPFQPRGNTGTQGRQYNAGTRNRSQTDTEETEVKTVHTADTDPQTPKVNKEATTPQHLTDQKPAANTTKQALEHSPQQHTPDLSAHTTDHPAQHVTDHATQDSPQQHTPELSAHTTDHQAQLVTDHSTQVTSQETHRTTQTSPPTTPKTQHQPPAPRTPAISTNPSTSTPMSTQHDNTKDPFSSSEDDISVTMVSAEGSAYKNNGQRKTPYPQSMKKLRKSQRRKKRF